MNTGEGHLLTFVCYIVKSLPEEVRSYTTVRLKYLKNTGRAVSFLYMKLNTGARFP